MPAKLRVSIKNMFAPSTKGNKLKGLNLRRPTSQPDFVVLCAINKKEKSVRLHKDVLQTKKDIYASFNFLSLDAANVSKSIKQLEEVRMTQQFNLLSQNNQLH